MLSLSRAVKAGTVNETTTWAPAALSLVTCGPMAVLVGS